jgi:predicted NAD-dependent protein-ADP-ribosyltransferase YbiA (DUF1768 family)
MMKTTVPSEHQALGRKAKGFNRAVWDQREWKQRFSLDALLTVLIDKSRIVEEGNYHKFTKSQESKHFTKMLLDTGDRELVEVSMIAYHDMSNDR